MTRKKYTFFHALSQKVGSSRPGAWFFSKVHTDLDRLVLRLTNNKSSLTATLSGLPVVVLSSTGAKSGLPRTTPLIGIPDEFGSGRFALIASNYGQKHNPSWYYNLKANPQATCSVSGHSGDYIAYEAEGEEYTSFWQAAVDMYLGYSQYKNRAEGRHIPIMIMTPVED